MKDILDNVKILTLALLIGVGVGMAHGWNDAPGSPPGCGNPDIPGCNALVDIGDGQLKQGGLSVGTGLAAEQVGFVVLNGKTAIGLGVEAPDQMLDVMGYSKSRTGFCINDDCIEEWPWEGAGGTVVELPPGTVLAFNLTTCPAGWSYFDGAEGKRIIGATASYPFGVPGGNETVTHTVGNMQSHTHTVNGGGSAGWLITSNNLNIPNCSGGSNCGNTNVKTGYSNTGGISFANAGGVSSQTLNVMNPYIPLTYCSKDLP